MLYRPHTGHIQATQRPHASHIQATYKPHRGHIQATFRSYTFHIQVTYSPHSGHIHSTYRPHSGHMKVTYRPDTGHIQCAHSTVMTLRCFLFVCLITTCNFYKFIYCIFCLRQRPPSPLLCMLWLYLKYNFRSREVEQSINMIYSVQIPWYRRGTRGAGSALGTGQLIWLVSILWLKF